MYKQRQRGRQLMLSSDHVFGLKLSSLLAFATADEISSALQFDPELSTFVPKFKIQKRKKGGGKRRKINRNKRRRKNKENEKKEKIKVENGSRILFLVSFSSESCQPLKRMAVGGGLQRPLNGSPRILHPPHAHDASSEMASFTQRFTIGSIWISIQCGWCLRPNSVNAPLTPRPTTVAEEMETCCSGLTGRKTKEERGPSVKHP
jgi:hypothetical protein